MHQLLNWNELQKLAQEFLISLDIYSNWLSQAIWNHFVDTTVVLS